MEQTSLPFECVQGFDSGASGRVGENMVARAVRGCAPARPSRATQGLAASSDPPPSALPSAESACRQTETANERVSPAPADFRCAPLSRSGQGNPFAVSYRAQSVREQWERKPRVAFEDWMRAGMGGKGFKERSQVVYRAMWNKLLKHAAQRQFSPALMDEGQIQVFLADVLVRSRVAPGNPSPTQQRRYLALLSNVQEELVGLGALQHNAARELLGGKTMREVTFLRSLPVVLLAPQEQALQAWVARALNPHGATSLAWRTRRDCALVCTVLGSGVKLHELQSLRLCDLLMKHPDSEEPAVVRITTNGAKERRSPLTPAFEEPLLSWMGWLREHGAHDKVPIFLSSEDDQAGAVDPGLELDLMAALPLAGKDSEDNGLRPMSSAQIWRVVHQAFIDCGFDEKLARHGPTVLRNTFAVRQLRAGASIDKVSLWLGHKDKRSTEVYRALLVEPGALDTV